MMKPNIGRIVLVPFNNGADVAPGIITRVWSDTCVNVRVLCDSENLMWKTSVALFNTAEEAAVGHSCYWPPRV
jgi:hypothetical protein